MTLRVRTVPHGPRVWEWTTRLLSVRLHRFNVAASPDLHDECRAFWSLVLWGELVETRWAVWPGGPWTAYRCDGDRLALAGTATAVALATYTRRRWRWYAMGTSDWHTVVARPGTWTLNLRGPVRKAHATVIRRGVRS